MALGRAAGGGDQLTVGALGELTEAVVEVEGVVIAAGDVAEEEIDTLTKS